MSGDDSLDTLSFADAYRQRVQRTNEAFDQAHGLVPDPHVDDGPFATLIHRVNAAVYFKLRDPTHELVELGRFELLECLGQGAFGAVFKARDTDLDRLVALKLFPAGSHTEEDLRREARALARVEHANIVQVYDIGRHAEEDALFIVMQYVEAVSLWSYAVEEKRPWSEVVEIFIQVGEALAAIHEAGVVHGDFKPANVIFDERTKTPYIVDFGLANIITPDFEEVVKGGTRHFMARELLLGGPTSELADLYAFCAALWCCLDQQPPYVGDNSDELLEDIEVVAEDVRFTDESIPERVREVLVVGLAQDPAERHRNMHAVVRELEFARGLALLPGNAETSQPALTLEPALEIPKKPKVVGPVVGLLLFVSLAGVLGELYIYQHSQSTDEKLADAITEEPEPEPEPATELAMLDMAMDVPESAEEATELEEQTEPFEDAKSALEAGAVQGCYNSWLQEFSTLKLREPVEAGWESLQLADSVEQVKPHTTTPAWIVVGAAEAFEAVGDGLIPVDPRFSFEPGDESVDGETTGWQQAARCRARAAKLFTLAKEPGDASQQNDCIKDNAAGEACRRDRPAD